VTASQAVIDAGNAVGTSSTPIQTAATTLTATGGAGGIYLTQTGSTSVGPIAFPVLSVNADATTTSASVSQNGVVSSAGAVLLTVTSGSLTVNGNLSSPAGVTLTVSGAIQENYAVTDSGSFTVTSSASITMASAASIAATSLNLTSSGDISVSTINTGS